VALPSETLPLHIFEDRYRRMIEECLEQEREFGILWLTEDELKSVGCACAVDSVIERGEDGQMNILVRGTCAFRLIERNEDKPYPSGTVEYLSDSDQKTDAKAALAAREVYAELVLQATDKTISPEDLQAMDAYEMAATVDFGSDAKQELLELRSETSRLRLLTLLLRAAIKRLDMIEHAQARARSNGKVHFR
jgi:Lon protease-like protein